MMWATLVGGGVLALFLIFQATGIYAGDAGDLVAAAASFGIPHPPGYPLYTALGLIVSHIPFSTIAWRLSLLSSIPHTFTVIIVYVVTFRLSRNRWAAFFAAMVLAGNYVFFLYSITPEVFALLDVFVAGFLMIAERWTGSKPTVSLALMTAFLLGLSLSHHHLIVSLVPALIYMMYTKPILRGWSWRSVITLVSASFAGLLPYLYIPLAALGSSAINWDRPVTLERFFHLVTRAAYGTFQSGASIDSGIAQRLLSIQAYLVFFLVDYTWIGVSLVGLGLWWVLKHQIRLFVFWVTALVFAGPVFAFYANFPLAGRFALGTLERFSLPSYVMAAPLAGLGAWEFARLIAVVIRPLLRPARILLLVRLVMIVLLLYPIAMGSMTLWRFWGMRADQTVNHFGMDLLASAPQNSIILLVNDTPLFVLQYLRYAQLERPDVSVIHVAKISFPDYQEVLRNQPEGLTVPNSDGSLSITEFIRANMDARPIVSNSAQPLDPDLAWVPYGMLYVLVNTAKPDSVQALLEKNELLWTSFHDPNTGILSRYKHLMLANVLDEYTQSAIRYADGLFRIEKYQQAKDIYAQAVAYGSDGHMYTALMRLGIAQAMLKNCSAALDALDMASGLLAKDEREILQYQGVIYRDCVGDGQKAADFFRMVEAATQKRETPLEQL